MSSSRQETEAPIRSAAARQDTLRLLIVSFDYRPRLGGVATCAFELAAALSREPGVKVRVLAPRSDGDTAFDAHGGFETSRRPLPSAAVRAVIPFSRWVREETRSWRPDALIALLWMPDGAAVWLGRGRRGAAPPYYLLAHGVELLESRHTLKKRVRSLLAPLKRRVFQKAEGIFPVSRYTAGLAQTEAGVAAGRLTVVYNGVDLEAFRPGPAPEDLVGLYGARGRRVFLTVTRLEDYKGVDRAIGALRRVIDDHPEALYLVGGEGPDLPRLQAMTQSLGLQNHVRFLGRLPTGRLADHYRLADCFVMLSRDDLVTPNVEGFGIVFLEAAACGRPSIAGRSGGIPDAVAEHETAWLVDPEDEQAIAAVMKEALNHPMTVAERGRNARLRAERQFTWDHMARRVLDRVRAGRRDHVRH
jgi:phosphatidylinositol alpha-1,6-mannosyltransferase